MNRQFTGEVKQTVSMKSCSNSLVIRELQIKTFPMQNNKSLNENTKYWLGFEKIRSFKTADGSIILPQTY